ncbi:MAG: hypothetical protein HZB10_02955, partial [Candidatus Yonathbacteria bacterium]|nr:hypothetical protein [Candidatus Yonathbacteria bacterium]
MTTAFFIILYSLFVYTAWTKFRFALGLLVFALPSYLIRFHIGQLPTTFLEGLILIVIAVWVIKKMGIGNWELGIVPPSLRIPIFLLLLSSILAIFTAPDIYAALGLWRAYIIEPLLFFIILL